LIGHIFLAPNRQYNRFNLVAGRVLHTNFGYHLDAIWVLTSTKIKLHPCYHRP
jgi:hypothetical protein